MSYAEIYSHTRDLVCSNKHVYIKTEYLKPWINFLLEMMPKLDSGLLKVFNKFATDLSSSVINFAYLGLHFHSLSIFVAV